MCHRQLAEYQEHFSEFTDKNIKLIALSVDAVEDARKFRDKESLGFDVGYGVDAKEFAASIGGFFDDAKGFLHASAFVLDAEGKIALSVYSSGSVGRLVPKDALALVGYVRK